MKYLKKKGNIIPIIIIFMLVTYIIITAIMKKQVDTSTSTSEIATGASTVQGSTEPVTQDISEGTTNTATPKGKKGSQEVAKPIPVKTVEVSSLKGLEKALKKKVTVYTKDANLIQAYDTKYLNKTNYTCLSGVKKGKYYFLDKDTLEVMKKENNRIKDIDKSLEVKKAIEGYLRDSGVLNTDDERQKLISIEKFMIKQFTYDMNYREGERADWSRFQDEKSINLYYLVKKKKGVCADFVELYRILCEKADIDCIVEYGGTKSKTTKSHAWNIVLLKDGTRLYKDITWDIQKKKRIWCNENKVTPKEFIKSHHMMCDYR